MEMETNTNRGEITFFVRNFPETCTTEDLWWKFRKVGTVVEVFIPGKRDVKGKRFAFARFADGVEEEKILRELNKTWVDSFIIRAFKPMYVKEQKWREEKERIQRRTESITTQKQEVQIRRNSEGRRLFSEVVKGVERVEGEKKREEGTKRVIEGAAHFQSTKKESEWLKQAYTGYMKGEFSWSEHGEEIQSECAGRLQLTSMGSNLVLIQGTQEKKVEEAIKELDEWAKFW